MFAFFEEMRLRSDFTDVDISFLYEWYSPKNQIVLNYGDEAQVWLIGAIDHEDYSLKPQAWLDNMALLMEVPRPDRYPVTSLEGLRQLVSELRGKEGVVAYDENGWPWKFKTLQYLALHYSRGRVNTFDKVIDIWLELGRPDYQTFFDKLVEKEDWETADYCRSSLAKIADAKKAADRILAGMKAFIERELKGLSRKAQYEKVAAAYGGGGRAGMVMRLIDGKDIGDDSMRKLMMQLTSGK